jgi:hypothetical protein
MDLVSPWPLVENRVATSVRENFRDGDSVRAEVLHEGVFFPQPVAIAYRSMVAFHENFSALRPDDAGGGKGPRTIGQNALCTAGCGKRAQQAIDFGQGEKRPVGRNIGAVQAMDERDFVTLV